MGCMHIDSYMYELNIETNIITWQGSLLVMIGSSLVGILPYRGNGHTVPLKSKLPPSRETRLVSLEIGLERNETSLERNETSLVSRECTGSTNALHSSAFKTCY